MPTFKNRSKTTTAPPAEIQDGTEAANIDVSAVQEEADCCLTDIDDCLSCVEDSEEEEIDEDPQPEPANYYNTQINWATATPEEEQAWDQGYQAYRVEFLAWSERNGFNSCVC